MAREIINTTITTNGKEHHVVVTCPFSGNVDVYHVYVDNYLHGQIVPSPTGLTPYIKSNVLSSDDIGAILDTINKQTFKA